MTPEQESAATKAREAYRKDEARLRRLGVTENQFIYSELVNAGLAELKPGGGAELGLDLSPPKPGSWLSSNLEAPVI